MRLKKFFVPSHLLNAFLFLMLLLPISQAQAAGSCYCEKDGQATCQRLDPAECGNKSIAERYGACSSKASEQACAGSVDAFNKVKVSADSTAGNNGDPLEKIKIQAQSTLNQFPDSTTPQQIIGIAIRGLTGFMGSIMFVLVVYAGVLFMTAQGNTERIDKAKKIMIWSTLGVAVMLLSYIVVNFVFKAIESGV